MSAASIGVLRLAGHQPGARAAWRWASLPLIALMIVQALAQAHPNPSPSYAAGDGFGARPYHTRGPNVSEIDYSIRVRDWFDPTYLERAHFPVSAERGDRATITVRAVPGQWLASNAMVMPPLVHISGARIIGRTNIDQAVLEVADDVTPNAAKITIRAAHPWPVMLGRVLSAIGLLGLFANAVALVLARRR